MYKLRKRYHNLTMQHPILGRVTFYKEADDALLKVWHKHCPEAVEYKEPKPVDTDDTNKEDLI